jgi:hypothetical protein
MTEGVWAVGINGTLHYYREVTLLGRVYGWVALCGVDRVRRAQLDTSRLEDAPRCKNCQRGLARRVHNG